MNDDKRDLILNDSIYKVLLKLSAPIMLANLIQTLYNIVDGWFVKEIGNTEFAATSFVWPVLFLAISVGNGLTAGGISLISQLLGSGEDSRANKYASNHMLLCFVGGIVVAIGAYFISPLLVGLMGGEQKLFDLSVEYLKIMVLGIPFQFVYFSFYAIMHAQGMPMASTIVGGLGAIINVVLDPIFIFDKVPYVGISGLGMGIQGAALATVASQACSMLAGLVYMHFKSKRIRLSPKTMKFDPAAARHIIKVTVPAATGAAGSSVGFIILNRFVVSYGENTLFAFGMINRLTSLLMQPMMGLGGGLTTIVGQNIGASRIDRAKEAFLKSVKLNIIMALIGGYIMIAYDEQIVGTFISYPTDDLLAQSIEYLHYTAIVMFAMGMFSVLQGFFQGTGHTKYSMMMAIGRLWFLRIPSIILFKRFTNLGSTGIWWAMCFSNIVIVMYGFAVYFQGKWKRRII